MRAKLEKTIKINSDDSYNAFTTMIFYNNQIWIAYRTGKGHLSPTSEIVVCNSLDALQWKEFTRISQPNLDLRDPYFAIINNELILLCFSLSYYDPDHLKFEPSDSIFFKLSKDTQFVLAAKFEYSKYHNILWSITEYNGKIFAMGYNFDYGHFTLRLFSTVNLVEPWQMISQIPEDLLPADKGLTEAEMVFHELGQLDIFSRVDQDSLKRVRTKEESKEAKKKYKQRKKEKSVKFPWRYNDLFLKATAQPPYKDWDVKIFPFRFMAPRKIIWKNHLLFVGRCTSRKLNHQIILFEFNENFNNLLLLAEGHDGSYAGLILHPNIPDILLISYYSDHAQLNSLHKGLTNDIWVSWIKLEE